jgi:hypothetical protein
MLLAERASYTERPPASDDVRALLDAANPLAVADGIQRMGTALQWSVRINDALALYQRVFDRMVPAGAIINVPEALFWYGNSSYLAGDLERATALVERLRVEAAHRSVHTRSHTEALASIIAFGRGDWAALRESQAAVARLIEQHPEASFCLATSSGMGYLAADLALRGQPPPDDLDAQVLRAVAENAPIRAASVMLPRAMTGDVEAVVAGLEAYRAGLMLGDRMRVWDPADLMPAISMTIVERWADLDALLPRLDTAAGNGGRVPGAVAAAIREERAAALEGGPAPAHAALRDLGYLGLSELIGFRPRSRDQQAAV